MRQNGIMSCSIFKALDFKKDNDLVKDLLFDDNFGIIFSVSVYKKTYFVGTQHRFLWRNKKNYPRIISKYPSLTSPLSFLKCDINSSHYAVLNERNQFLFPHLR